MKKILSVLFLSTFLLLSHANAALIPVTLTPTQACYVETTAAATCLANGGGGGFSFKCDNVFCRRYDTEASHLNGTPFYLYQCNIRVNYAPDIKSLPFQLEDKTLAAVTETMLTNPACTQKILYAGKDITVECPVLLLKTQNDPTTNACMSADIKVGN